MSEFSSNNAASSPNQTSVAVIVGSAFSSEPPKGLKLSPVWVDTPWGEVALHEAVNQRADARVFVIFRHGLPHQTLPHLVNYRGYAFALKRFNCEALLITSSVGVLDDSIPLDQPLIVTDLLMPDQRLPTGEVCTVFDERAVNERSKGQWSKKHNIALTPGHLVLSEGLFSVALSRQLSLIIEELQVSQDLPPLAFIPEVTFAYAPGPRTKTAAENRYWKTLGAQVNSMSLGPEVVLANELEISCAALVIGHKRSSGRTERASIFQKREEAPKNDMTQETKEERTSSQEEMSEMTATLKRSHQLLESIVINFLNTASPTPYQNYIYRFPSPK